MTRSSLKGHWKKAITTINTFDGLFLLWGFVGLVVGMLFASPFPRAVGFGIGGVALAIGGVSLLAKRNEILQGMRNTSSPSWQHVEGNDMKKLFFDDFQSDFQRKYAVKEVEEVGVAAAVPANEMEHGSVQVAASPPPPSGSQTRSPANVESPHVTREFQISDFFDVDSDVYKDRSGNSGQVELRTEFDFLLNKVLAVIKEVVFAHSVVFFWANHEKRHLVCEAKNSDSDALTQQRRIPMGTDIVSKVARSGKPELINRVNPVSERELLCYYDQPEYIKSFIGVPVFYPGTAADQPMHEPVGVIAIDSKVEDAFGPETISLLGQFTKLVSALIKTSTDKYDLLLNVELLNSIRRFQERIRNDLSVASITQMLSEEVGKLINWSFLAVVLHDEEQRRWMMHKVVNRVQEPYVSVHQSVDFGESIVGKVIKSNTHVVVGDLEREALPRFAAGEKLPAKGSFVGVPISSLNKCYGAICLESRDTYNFSRKDVEMLYRLAENAASALEILYLNEIINEYVIVDDLTGLHSKKFFLDALTQELHRADDYGNDLSLVLVAVDNAGGLVQRYGETGMESVLLSLSKLLRSATRSYDVVGRYDSHRFSVMLANTTANDAYLWAEKLRKTIASHVMNADGKSFSVTVSIGVCGATEGMQREEMLANTLAVLSKATDGGGNSVRVF